MQFVSSWGAEIASLFGISFSQLVQLLAIGGGGAMVFWGLLFSLQQFVGLGYILANCIAEVPYVILKFAPTAWVFRNRNPTEFWQQVEKFFGSEVIIFAATLTLLSVALKYLKVHPLIAQLAVSVMLTAILSIEAARWSFTP